MSVTNNHLGEHINSKDIASLVEISDCHESVASLCDTGQGADSIKLSWKEENPSKGSFWTARFYF